MPLDGLRVKDNLLIVARRQLAMPTESPQVQIHIWYMTQLVIFVASTQGNQPGVESHLRRELVLAASERPAQSLKHPVTEDLHQVAGLQSEAERHGAAQVRR